MLNAIHVVMLFAHAYTWGDGLCSMLYKGEILCSLLYIN